ncbi:unnamed protein product [Phytophthora lilii]|uniref:Unnamed protein product n=1 Tax=Phytophthora lilii TaxID=2077276 RepID=A0A9W7CRC0_9STRA|nr:unnamed protein product [Phytophthora lilii]
MIVSRTPQTTVTPVQLTVEDWNDSTLLADVETLLSSQDITYAILTTDHDREHETDSRISNNSENEEAIAVSSDMSKEACRRKVYRLRQKNRLDTLRQQELVLQAELVRLKESKAQEKVMFNASQPPAYFLWKSVAKEQLDKRLQAEEEWRQLKQALSVQATYIQSIVEILRSAATSSISSSQDNVYLM